MILHEPSCEEIALDHYTWTDPCNRGACPAAASGRPGSLRPRGVPPRDCEWAYGCERWVDEEPTPQIVSDICGMPTARAREYLRGLEKVRAIRLSRGFPTELHPRPEAVLDDVTFVMEMHGIVTAGGETDIVWRSTAPAEMASGAAGKGHHYQSLPAQGWYVKHSWN